MIPTLEQREAFAARRHVSYNFLNSMNSCLLSWFGHYVLSVPERRSGPQYLGLTVHDVLNRANRGLIDSSLASVVADYHEGWVNQRAWTPCDLETEVDWSRSTPDGKERQAQMFHKAGAEVLKLYFAGSHHLRNKPAIYGEEVLSEFELKVPLKQYGASHLTHLLGYIDIVTSDGRLLDYKCKSYNRITPAKYEVELQPPIYAWGLTDLKILDAPVEFRYGQLLYNLRDKGSKETYEQYDESVGDTIPAWKIDAMRYKVIPGLVRRAEDIIDIVLNHSDPLSYMQSHIRPGTACDWCDVKRSGSGLCPFFQVQQEPTP